MALPTRASTSASPTGHLHELCALALGKANVWPGQLFAALDTGNLVGRGLVICSVDARGLEDEDARLQNPLATDEFMAPLCQMLQSNELATRASNYFKSILPGTAAHGFLFVPADAWKSLCEPALGISIPRKSLKATNALRILASCTLPSGKTTKMSDAGRVMLVQFTVARAGATLPKELCGEAKEAFFLTLRSAGVTPEDVNSELMKCMGLDPVALGEEPVFRALVKKLAMHIDDWKATAEHYKARLLFAWGVSSELMNKDKTGFELHILRFFTENLRAMEHLWEILGEDRVSQVMESADFLMLEEQTRMENYANHLGRELMRPCPICGKPLESKAGLICKCQRPLLPVVPPVKSDPPAIQHEDPGDVRSFMKNQMPRYRRKKNIQTCFNLPSLRKPPESSQNRSQDTSTTHPTLGPEPFITSAMCRQKVIRRAKEPNPTMTRLREQIRQHIHVNEQAQDDEQGRASPTTSRRQCGVTRRSRRSMPQGDRKFAHRVAAAEILSGDMVG